VVSFAANSIRADGVRAMKIAWNLSLHQLLTFSIVGSTVISEQLTTKELIFAKSVCGKLP
jgi:hypothetical protein